MKILIRVPTDDPNKIQELADIFNGKNQTMVVSEDMKIYQINDNNEIIKIE